MNKAITQFLMTSLIAWMTLLSTATDAATPEAKGTYTQKKYHVIRNKVQEWHNSDFNLVLTLKGDFSLLEPNSEVLISIGYGAANTVILSGVLNQLGSFKTSKTGGKITFAPGQYHYQGSMTWNQKQLVLKLAAKTSRETDNYLLPIDEDIYSSPNTVRPPFTGSTELTIGILPPTAEQFSFRNYRIDYKGTNKCCPLPSQTIKAIVVVP